ncbi:MAG: hypothetical protein NT076_03140 [Candidatus Pacearchaeota archaeon]|nr:hypothetical protein [Candidatus Pacearchaeota archaeon]
MTRVKEHRVILQNANPYNLEDIAVVLEEDIGKSNLKIVDTEILLDVTQGSQGSGQRYCVVNVKYRQAREKVRGGKDEK